MFPLRLSRSSSAAPASFDASSSFGWSRRILSTAEPAPEGDRRHDLAHIGGHVVGDGVPETPVESGEFPLPLVLVHALVLVEEREDADEARTGQGQDSAPFLETRGSARL